MPKPLPFFKQQSLWVWSYRARLSINDKKSLHMEKEAAFLGMPFLARNGAQTSCTTVQKKWKKRLKKKLEIQVQKQLLQMEAHQTIFFCTSKQILVISKCFLSISFKGSGIPGYRDFYPVKGIETFFSLTWGTHFMSAVEQIIHICKLMSLLAVVNKWSW